MKKLFIVLILLALGSRAQDSSYARKVIRELCSKKYAGRGYVNEGLKKAADYIAAQMKKNGAKPLFATGYFQEFKMSVNTFSQEMSLNIGGKMLVPGKDFLVAPESQNIDATFSMEKIDSVTWKHEEHGYPFFLEVKKKLAWSVSTHTAQYSKMEVLESSMPPGIPVVDVDINNHFFMDLSVNNVCGFIPGKTNNDTMIVFTAHYDHLGMMGDATYFPGANDNASGTAFVLNLVKHYKKNPPKYKTVFVFFAGEEAGLLGSQHFVDKKTVALDKIKFLVNLDLLGTGDDGVMFVNGATHEKEFARVEKINAEKKYVKEVKKRGKAKNSDHYWFSEAGVPAFFLYTLGGVGFYHDVMDRAETLPLTDYCDVFKLVTDFIRQF